MTPECAKASDNDAAATRAAIIGTRKTPAEIAVALGCCERTIVNLINEERLPFVRFLGRRYIEPETVAAALRNRERNRAPRKPGRPSTRQAA